MSASALSTHYARSSQVSRDQSVWQPGDPVLPAIYIGHGAPPLLDDERWMAELFDWVIRMPKPTGILIVSAHWEAAPLMITSSTKGTPLVYDFTGFEQRFYEMSYVSPDATALAERVAGLMPDTEPLHVSTRRGLDHGAWVPLTAMFPLADVPVLQVSLPTHDPLRLMQIGERLRELRAEGVLIIGSGFLTHGLPYLTPEHWRNPDAAPPAWSVEFDAWAAEALVTGNIEELLGYTNRAPALHFAHPTVEHLSPIFVTLGAASDPTQPVETVIDGYFMGLTKRSIEVA